MLLTEYRVSERRACATVLLECTVYRYVELSLMSRDVSLRLKLSRDGLR